MSIDDISGIDRAVDADGVLAALLWSLGTPEGLEPQRLWSNCFPGESTPVWMWLRSPSPRIEFAAEWGMYRMEGEFDVGPDGVFCICGVSIDDSALVVELSHPGWVDFGRSELPIEVLDTPVIDAMELVSRATSAGGSFTDMLSSNVAARYEKSRPRELAALDETSLRSVESFIRDTGESVPPQQWPRGREGRETLDRPSFTRLREARGLSLTEVARRLEELTGSTCSKDTLRRFESGSGQPADPLLPAALDHVLGGNGHVALVVVASGSGNAAITLPAYWQAPVWIAFDGTSGTDGDDVAELGWGDWRRVVRGNLPLTVICHASMDPLRVAAAPSIQWVVGLGRREGAWPINSGWVPGSVDTTQQALSRYQDVFVGAVQHLESVTSRRGRGDNND